METLEEFVADLCTARIGLTVNPYASAHESRDLDRPGAAAIRACNLLDYLSAHSGARVMLVGEAPGYRGCRFSGIPFLSERDLPPESRSSLRPDAWREASATIVQRALAELRLESETVLWNALPLHPAGAHPLTNRRPTAQELRAGAGWLQRLLDVIRPTQVVAVGMIAGALLPEARVLRHPAHGGASTFRRGLKSFIAHP